MKTRSPQPIRFGVMFCFLFLAPALGRGQQQDVPEPVFMYFSIQPLYIPTYHGRDPFKPLDNIERGQQVSIAELDFRGTMRVGGLPIALFTWRGNPSVRYTLKSRKLYGAGEQVVDGVVGDISESRITLSQGQQKVEFPRK